MNKLQFGVALAALVGLAVFVYFQYPSEWRRHRFFRILFASIHVLGAVSLTCVMTSIYAHIPSLPLKLVVTVAGSFFYVVVVSLSILYGVRLVVRKLLGWYYARKKTDPPKPLGDILADEKIHAAIFLVLTYSMAAAGFVNIGILHETSYQVTIDKPSTTKSLTISLIADLHVGSGGWRSTMEQLPGLINKQNPDVLLIAGDVFDETTSAQDVEYVRDVISRVHPPMGTYFCYGNHDDYHDDWAGKVLREMGATVLEDEMVTLGDDIQLLGRLDPIDNWMSFDDLLRQEGVDLSKPLLVLTHRPKQFKIMGEQGADLVVAGHTHGFNVPQFLAAGWRFDMYSGIGQYDDMTAIVTSGVAAWGFHYKWPAISEVVTIHVDFADAA